MCIIYGALLELYQGCFLPYRNGSWVDELANCIGASAAYFYNLIKIRKDPTNFRSVK